MAEKVAVVVPVLDEAETLPALLADLAAQEPRVGEIVVVDAGSADGTLELLRAHGSLRLVEAPGATPGRGRNEGVRAATAPHRRHAGRRQPGRPRLRRRARPRGGRGAGRGRRQRAGRAHRLRARSGLVHAQGVQAGGALGPDRRAAPAGRAQRGLLHARGVGGRGRLSPRASLGRGQGLPTRAPCCGPRDRRRAGGRRALAPARLAAGGLPPVPQLRARRRARPGRPPERARHLRGLRGRRGAGGVLRARLAHRGRFPSRRRGRLPRALHPRRPSLARLRTPRSPGSRRSGSSSTWPRCRAFSRDCSSEGVSAGESRYLPFRPIFSGDRGLRDCNGQDVPPRCSPPQ